MPPTVGPKVALTLHPVPKTVLRPALAGEMLKNLGMRDADQINAVQQAIAEGLIVGITVAARHANGRYETFELAMKPHEASETVSLDLSGGKSYLEAVDVGLAGAVHFAANLIKRRGLTPEFFVTWSARVSANPAIMREAIERLNLKVVPGAPPAPVPADFGYADSPCYAAPSPPATQERYGQSVNSYTSPPKLPPDYTYKPVVTITPAKDPGVTFTHMTSRRTT